MQVKIDTSERFHVITIRERMLSANMTEEIINKLYSVLKQRIKNIVLNWQEVASAESAVMRSIISVQEQFYTQKASFVNCCLQPEVKAQLSAANLEELLNTAPTQSEAIDIVQMEEIERELEEE